MGKNAMAEPGVEQVRLVLSTDNKAEWKRVYAQLLAHVEPGPASERGQERDIRIVEIEKIDVLGAFEPIFLIAMGATVLLSGSGVGLWCLAHERNGGGRIPLDSPEGRAVVDAITNFPSVAPTEKNTVSDEHAIALLNLLGSQNEAERAYRARLREQLGQPDDLGVLRTASGRLRETLRAFAGASCPLSDYGFLDDVIILPTHANVFGNISVSGTEIITASYGFLDLLAFHHRATVAFRMCEILAQRGVGEVAGSRKVRAALHLAHLHLIGCWLVEQFPLEDLPAADASPTLLHEETRVLSQGLLFLLLHEHAHSELGHRSANPPAMNLNCFNLVTAERLDEAKSHELAADAWAARAMWPSIMLPSQATAVVRIFLLIGLGQAANGRFSDTHPYVSNRLSHFTSVLRSRNVDVRALEREPAQWLAREYDEWRRLQKVNPAIDHITRAVGLLSVEAAKLWVSSGADEAFFRRAADASSSETR